MSQARPAGPGQPGPASILSLGYLPLAAVDGGQLRPFPVIYNVIGGLEAASRPPYAALLSPTASSRGDELVLRTRWSVYRWWYMTWCTPGGVHQVMYTTGYTAPRVRITSSSPRELAVGLRSAPRTVAGRR